MNAVQWSAPTRNRAVRDDVLSGSPVILVLATLAWRVSGVAAAVVILVLGIAAVVALAKWRARRFDRRWLVAALDAARGDLEDSSDLLFSDPAALSPVQRLQRTRIAARFHAAPLPSLAAPRDPRLLAAAWVVVCLLAVAILAWPAREPPLAPAQEGLRAIPGVPRLATQRLDVIPPAYTGLPRRSLATLDARVPAGSRLEWTFGFTPDPAAATLAFVARPALALSRDAAVWRGALVADRSFLYRVVPAGAARAGTPPLHRIDTVADQPPRIRVEVPAATLVMLAPGQRVWPLSFAVTDDYGVRPDARLRLVIAQGEEENVRFSERVVTIGSTGTATERRFSARIDIAALGFSEPGDLVAQLTVADNAPASHRVAGPSLILRRPPPAGAEGGGLEAMTRRVLPAYFRSQRQIIIDAEALLRDRPRLSADAFLARSDALGTDQSLLRMRYGQFMGEENAGASIAMPTNDEEEGTAAPTPPPTPAPDAHHADDGHDHAPAFGAADGVVEGVGHMHDEPEAATLLDPATRATLRIVLDTMRQSETALRQGDPRRAMPFAHQALRALKQLQQATRIFLARTGSQLPEVDFGRRLTGDRGAMGARILPSAAADPIDATPGAIWRALDTPRHAAALDALQRWLAASASRVPDPLALAGAIDTVRRRPDCAACREALRGALWQALPRPAPGLSRRDAGDAVGRRYLDALP